MDLHQYSKDVLIEMVRQSEDMVKTLSYEKEQLLAEATGLKRESTEPFPTDGSKCAKLMPRVTPLSIQEPKIARIFQCAETLERDGTMPPSTRTV